MTRPISPCARRAIAYSAMFVALAVTGTGLRAQATAPAVTPAVMDSQTSVDPPTSYDQLLRLQPADNAPYSLGRGDAVSINVEGRPELTGKQVIGPDGSVTLPLIGSLSVVDKTRDEAAESIRRALLKYYTNPIVTVSVEAYNSNRVLLLGAVERPGEMVFDHMPTLLEVLARGGSATRAQGSVLRAATDRGRGAVDPLPDRCMIYRGVDTVIRLDLRGLVASGSPLANLRLKRDDTVYVPAAADRSVSVLGQVQRPGSQVLDGTTTLAQLLADAGGLTPQAGNNPKIQIVAPSTGKKREIEFKSLLNPKSSEVRLEPGDVVFIPQSGFNSATYSLERLSPLISVFTTAALLNNQ